MEIRHNISLLGYNTFGIDENADTLIEYGSVEELRQTIAEGMKAPVLHIGGGSNLLFLKPFEGTVLKSAIMDLEVVDETDCDVLVRIGAGWVMDDFIAYSIEKGWYGLENLSLIPGQVGASAVQNIGAYGVEACDCIEKVHCVSMEDGSLRVFDNSECNYAYRHSIFKEEAMRGRFAVTHVDYRLKKTFTAHLEYGGLKKAVEGKENLTAQEGIDNLTAQELRDIIIGIRREKLPDPEVTGNAGSFFMNPVVAREKYDEITARYPNAPHYDVDAAHVKVPAGWMIEMCGWKGRSLGAAAVHNKQALVLVNTGGAKGTDILALCNAVISDVKKEFGIELKPEVNFI